MAAREAKQPCATLGDFIAGVVLKELWSVQLLRREPAEEGAAPFDPAPLKALVEELAPSIAHDVLEAAQGWVPEAAELSPSSLLPDLDVFPAVPQDADGLSVAQRRLLLEALEVVLDVFDDESNSSAGTAVIDGASELSRPLLPRTSMACIAAQVAAALEHSVLLRPRASAASAAPAGASDLDLTAWRRICAARGEAPAADTREVLVVELQRSRQRIFELEKELLVQAKSAELMSSRGRREHDQAVSRLLHVNKALEERLRQRTEEHRRSTERMSGLERRLQHEEWLTEEKAKRIGALEDQITRSARMQYDILMREKEYGKRILRLNLKEFEGLCHDGERVHRLERVLTGDMAESEKPELTEAALAELARRTLGELEVEFGALFDERQRRFEEAVARCEASLEERQKALEQAGQRIMVAHRNQDSASRRHTSVQTEPRHRVDLSLAATAPAECEPRSPREPRSGRREVRSSVHRKLAATTEACGGNLLEPVLKGRAPAGWRGAPVRLPHGSGPARDVAVSPKPLASFTAPPMLKPIDEADPPWLARRWTQPAAVPASV